jgi:hypothetical protein
MSTTERITLTPASLSLVLSHVHTAGILFGHVLYSQLVIQHHSPSGSLPLLRALPHTCFLFLCDPTGTWLPTIHPTAKSTTDIHPKQDQWLFSRLLMQAFRAGICSIYPTVRIYKLSLITTSPL